MMDGLNAHPHVRWNPLTATWVQVSPQRTERPWQGAVEAAVAEEVPSHDPACYLCPGVRRANGETNPRYDSTFVFDNDFPALRASTPAAEYGDDPLLLARTEPGVCRVICFTPRHDLTMSRLDVPALGRVVDTWAEQTTALGRLPHVGYVQIFENRGAQMGASNPHPHCQVWAPASVPNEPAREQASLLAYKAAGHACLLCDYLARETRTNERLVAANDAFAAIVPFWAIWPFELLVIPKRHVQALDALRDDERRALADILKRVTTRYDNLFETPFPYSMGFHQRPSDGGPHDEWHLHTHFYPPLLRSATVRKSMVGYELLGTPQRDITPEDAAARLRAVREEHYRDRPDLAATRR